MGKKQSQATPATRALTSGGVAFTVHTYDHDPANTHFGEESVAALGFDAAMVFKTLVAELVGGPLPMVCAVVPVSGQLDLKAIAHAADAKRASMADPAVAERITGYVVGGISPLGQKRQLPVWIDSSAQSHPTIIVSGGRRGLSIEVNADDLAHVISASFAHIAR